ncbi:unnamed protein product [Rhodiola kirilowii]
MTVASGKARLGVVGKSQKSRVVDEIEVWQSLQKSKSLASKTTSAGRRPSFNHRPKASLVPQINIPV